MKIAQCILIMLMLGSMGCLGLSLRIPHELNTSSVVSQEWPPFYGIETVEYIEVVLSNGGNNTIKKDIHLLEAIPSFLKVKSVEYSELLMGRNISTEKLSIKYDVKQKGKIQYVPIHIKLGPEGFEIEKLLIFRIHVKPNMDDFLKNYKLSKDYSVYQLYDEL